MSTTDPTSNVEDPGEDGFVCPTCNQSYSRAEYLRRHQRKHTEVRPFSCANCPKTFARSDVLLRHRRRVHPTEAAEEEANKPLPAAAPGPKKPPRRRNRNAHRPYPSQYRAQPDSAESDPESPTEHGLQNHLTESAVSFVLDATGISPGPGDTGAFEPSPLPDLFWSPNELSSPSSLSSASPPQNTSQTFPSDSLPTSISPRPQRFSPLFGPQVPTTHDDHAQAMATGVLPGPSTISPLEAGALAWALSPSHQSHSGAPFQDWHHPLVSEINDSMWSLHNYRENTFQLPFVSPDAGTMSENDIAELIRHGDWESIREAGVDVFNTEYAMINSESRLRRSLSGSTVEPTSKFYIPPGLFAGCYTVPHWLLPPLQRLSVFAANSLRNILCHFGVVHEPTFRLAEAHAWLAFAMCTAAGHQPFKAHQQWVEPEPWDAVQSVVRTEKTGMFVKLFARAGSKLPAAETFSGIQALLIYNAQSFLSDNPSDRAVGDLFLSTISKIARRSGVFDPNTSWAKPEITLTDDIGTDWMRWIRSESCRRTIWLVYLLDTQSSLEIGAISLVYPRDVRHLPLPASNASWNAASAITWGLLTAHATFTIFTLDDAMQKIFDFSAEPENLNGGFGMAERINPDDGGQSVTPSVLDILTLGPFARQMIIITILRGLIEYGSGVHGGGYVVQRWITGGQNGHLAYNGDDQELLHQSIMSAFNKALVRWKNGWEFDPLCPKADSAPPIDTQGALPPSAGGPTRLFNQDAMPFWWMCQLLVTHINGTTQSPLGGEVIPGLSPRFVEEAEDGEGLRRLKDIDLAATFATAKSLADPFGILGVHI